MSVLRISSMLALAVGCALFAITVVRWWNDGLEAARMRGVPTIMDRLALGDDKATEPSESTSPLVAQARVFAAYLTPPLGLDVSPKSAPAGNPRRQAVLRPPVAPSATLKLHATSCYPDRPEKSMALVSLTGMDGGNQRWVKEGAQIGPFVIHEIRRGEIAYQQDDHMHQAVLDRPIDQPSLVRDLRHDSERVSAVFEDSVRAVPIPAGPNDVDISSD